jgi:hypothetical protein
VRIAESTADPFSADEDYRPVNMEVWANACGMFADCVEPVIALPEPSYDEIVGRLAGRGVSLGEARVVPPPADPPAATQGTSGDPQTDAQSMPAARSPDTASDKVT